MRWTVCLAGSIALLVFTSAASASPRPSGARASAATVPRFEGEVGPSNAGRLLQALADRVGTVVGLQITLAPSDDATFKRSRYLVVEDADHISLSKAGASPGDGGYEMVASPRDATHDGGRLGLSGFFRVRSGGMQQGTIAFGLEKVREAETPAASTVRTIRLPR